MTATGLISTLHRALMPAEKKALSSPSRSGGWLPIIRESFAGAWQKNVEIDNNKVLTQHAVFACMTLIASDIAKLRIRLVQKDADGIWEEVEKEPYSDLLRKPNHMQTRIQFWEHYVLSKLGNGNVYALKERDNRGQVTGLYVLDPHRVQPLVSDSGDVFYRLSNDNISRLPDEITVPAREIIHDRMNCLFHPLIGLSPIIAAGLAATQSLNLQQDSALFAENHSTPSGILTAPGSIGDTTAERLKKHWEDNYGGKNRGRVAVMGDGLKFEPMRMTSRDSQVIEQLKWTAEVVCSVFHVPPYKIGVGALPSYNNIQALNTEYYQQALQFHMEGAELALDEGLGIGSGINKALGVEFEIEGLMRMDTKTQIESIEKAVGGGIMAPNEGRRKIDLKPVAGGNTPYLQQQMWSLEQLNNRSAPDDASAADLPPEPDQTNMAIGLLNMKSAETLHEH